MEISVSKIIGKSSAILHTDGLALFEKLASVSKEPIAISFKDIAHCTTAFLNASIGKFVILQNGNVKRLNFVEVSEEIKQKIDLVIDNAIDEKKRISLSRSAEAILP